MAQLSIFLIRQSIKDPDEVLRDREDLDDIAVRANGKHLGILYVKAVPAHSPKWIKYFDANSDISTLKLKAQSVAAVLLLGASKRTFALTFGYGRFLLQDGVVEPRFGLRVTLNSVEPSKLRSIDHERLDGIPRITREQLSRADRIGQFGLDVERDLLRSLTGSPKDQSLGRRLTGADNLSVVGDIPLEKIAERLSSYLALADKQEYRQDFGWVDTIAAERDLVTIAALEAKLVRSITTQTSTVSLAVPEPIDWGAVQGFTFGSNGSTPADDMDLGSFLSSRGKDPLTIEALRKERIGVIGSEDGSPLRSWQAFRCLVAEVSRGKAQYVLSNGNWYRVDQEFLQRLEDDVARIPISTLKLPQAKAFEKEGDYNKRAAKKSASDLHLLDEDFVLYPKRGKVEICDLYHRGKALVHVKRYRGSSSLSHLFLQGTVSAELMLSEVNFRVEFDRKLPKSFAWGVPSDPIRAEDFQVCLAVIGREGGPEALPFFGRLGLRNTVTGLDRMGFRTSYLSIPVK